MVIGIPPRKTGPRLGWSVHWHQVEAALSAKACKFQGAELVECSLGGRENEGTARWRAPRLAVAENFFNVFREVWIEDRRFAGFFFVCFDQRDALGDAAAHRLSGMKNRDGPRTILDDDLRACTHTCHQRSNSRSLLPPRRCA